MKPIEARGQGSSLFIRFAKRFANEVLYLFKKIIKLVLLIEGIELGDNYTVRSHFPHVRNLPELAQLPIFSKGTAVLIYAHHGFLNSCTNKTTVRSVS